MKGNYLVLYQTGLFGGISEEEIDKMMNCLHAREGAFHKGEFIFREGDRIQEAGVILAGKVHIVQEDFWGNCNIVSVMQEGDIFGEVYACLGNEKLRVSICAQSECRILFLNLQKAMRLCKNTCFFHQKLVENLVYSISGKNQMLTAKIQHLSKRNIRGKVLSYLSEESRRQESSYITLPFTRQQMADFLAVDRSALSKELARMKEEGLIEYERNHFRLILHSRREMAD